MSTISKVSYPQLGKNGRLANQYFQIADTIAYALDTNRDFVFPPWEYSQYMQKQLPVGGIDGPVQHHKFPFHYEPIPPFLGHNVDLFGHGQSAAYFEPHWRVIKPYLTLADNSRPLEHYRNLTRRMPAHVGTVCAIHVRRTDYDTPINLEFHGCLDIDYYFSAIRALYDDLRCVQFIVFSDEPEKAREMFGKWLKIPNIVYSEGRDMITDLYTMALCHEFIIANSSYSWWGAFLSEHKQKRVVCPKRWFVNAPGHDSKDVACKNWIVI